MTDTGNKQGNVSAGWSWRRWLVSLCLLLLVAVACLIVKFGVFGRSYVVTPDPAQYPVRGVDLSAHNGQVDFESLKLSGVRFVMLKASEGATHQDRRFVENMRNATKSGLKVGAYHFFRFDTPGDLQALNFLNAVRGRHLDFPVVIDVECWGNPSNFNRNEVIAGLTEMVKYLESRGHRVMLYTNKQGYDLFISGTSLASLPLWICSFTDPPVADSIPWHLWQHSHRGRLDGVSGAVDLNTFNGSRNAFMRFTEHNTVDPVDDEGEE